MAVVWILAAIGCTATTEVKRNQADALRNVARQYTSQGDHTTALRNLLEAEQIFDKDPELHNDLGLTYMEKNELDKALAHFQKALDLKPDYAYARNNKAIACLRGQRWDEAITTLEPLLKDLLYDTPHVARSNLGFAYYSKKDYARAENYYKQALDLVPGFVPALHGLGLTFLEKDQAAQAVAVLEKAVRQAPRIAVLHYDLARALERTGNRAQAQAAYTKVLEIENREGPLAAKAAEALDKLR